MGAQRQHIDIGQCRIYMQRISSIDLGQGDCSSVGALDAVKIDSYHLLTLHPLLGVSIKTVERERLYTAVRS